MPDQQAPIADYSQDIAAVTTEPPKSPAPQDYSQDIAEVDQEHRQPIITSAYSASLLDPDRHGKVVEMADKMGVGADLVDRNLEYFNGLTRYNADVQGADMAVLAEKRPHLYDFLKDRDNTALASGDIHVLSQLHDRMAYLYPQAPVDDRQAMPWTKSIWDNFARIWVTNPVLSEQTLTAIPALIQQAGRDAFGVTGEPGKWTPLGHLYDVTDIVKNEQLSADAYKQSSAQKYVNVAIGAVVDPTNMIPLGAAYSATKALVTLDNVVRSAVGVRAASMAMAGQSAAGAVDQIRQQQGTTTIRDAADVAAQAAFAYMIGKAGGLIGPLREAAGLRPTVKTAVEDFARLSVQNATQSAGARTISGILTDQPLPTSGELAGEAATGAVGGAAFGLLSLPGALRERVADVAKKSQEAIKAQEDARNLAGVAAALNVSDTNRRSPGRIKSLMDSIAKASGQENTGKVFFQPEAWNTYWQSKGQDPSQVATDLTGNKETMAQAHAEGSKIEIPAAEFLSKYAGTEHFAGLLGDVAMRQDAPTFNESNEFLKNSPEALNELHNQIVKYADASQDAIDQQRQQIKEQVSARIAELRPELSKKTVGDLAEITSRVQTKLAKMVTRDGAVVNPLDLHNSLRLTNSGHPGRIMGWPDLISKQAKPIKTDVPVGQEIQIPAREVLRDGTAKKIGKPNAQDIKDAAADWSGADQATAKHGMQYVHDELAKTEAVMDSTPIIQAANVPYGAGMDVAGTKIFMDPNFVHEAKLSDGKVLGTLRPTKVHEITETRLMNEGMSYGDAHDIANAAERAYLKKQGLSDAQIKEYETEIYPALRKTRDWTGEPPAELNRKPYEEEGELGLLSQPEGKYKQPAHIDASTGLPLNPDGTVTLYHHTSKELADQIRKTKTLTSKGEPDVYLTTSKDSDTGYGDTAVAIDVNPDRLQIDDEFPGGRQDYRIHVGSGKSLKIQPSRYEQSSRGGYSPLGDGRSLITYGDKADPSTHVHELMHYTLDTLAHYTSMEGASVELKRDMQTLLDFTGYKSLENKRAMEAELDTLFSAREKDGREFTPDEQRRVTELSAPHEKLAKAFEKYFEEGKAPTPELSGMFRRMARLMAEIYKSVKNYVTLTPEVRDVFDRLLASEDELTIARLSAGAEPLFQTKEQAGMTEKEFAAYQAKHLSSIEDSRNRLDGKFLKAHFAKVTEEYKAEHEQVRSEILSHQNEDKGQRAVSILQRGKLPDGTDVPAAGKFKINTVSLKESFTKEEIDALPKGVHARDGLPLHDVADAFGFKDGEDLYNALKDAPDLESHVDKLTQDEMDKRHPDMMKDGTAPEAAHRAINSYKRVELLNDEAQALAKTIGRVSPPHSLIRILATERMGSMVARTIRPEAYRAVEIKAGREAAVHMAKGNVEKAYIAKQRQLLNAELYRAASDAKAEAQKSRDYIRSFTKASKKKMITKAGGTEWTVTRPDGGYKTFASIDEANQAAIENPGAKVDQTSSYLAAVNRILMGVNTKNISLANEASRQQLVQFMEEANAKGETVNLDPKAIAEAQRKPWNSMTINDLRNLHDALSNLEHAARVKLEQSDAAKKGTAANCASVIRDAILAGGKKALPPTLKKPSSFAQFIASNFRVNDIIRRMDEHQDGGPIAKILRDPYDRAGEAEAVRSVEATTHINGLINNWHKLKVGSANAYMLNRGVKVEGIPQKISKLNEIMVALNWGNAGNRERLMSGQGWNLSQVDTILRRLDAKDWELVRGVWKHIDSYWPEIKALEEKHNGNAPEKVQATPFMTKHGEQPGGYFPVAYDMSKGKHPPGELDDVNAMMSGKGYVRAATSHGHTEARTGDAHIPLDLNWEVIGRHVQRVIHDLTHRDLVVDQNRIFNHPEFTKTILSHYGDPVLQQFKYRLMEAAGGARRDLTEFDSAVGFIRQNFNAAIRAFNVTGVVMQFAGLPAAIPRFGVVPFLKALPRALDVTGQSWKQANEWAPLLKTRNMEHNANIGETIGRLDPMAPLLKIRASAYLLHGYAWTALDQHAFWAGYYKTMAETGGNHDESVLRGTQIMVDTQGALRKSDMAKAMGGGELKKIFTSNMSWSNANFNLIMGSMHEFLDRKGHTPEAAVRMAAQMGTYLIVAPMLYYAARQFLTGQNMDEWKDPKKMALRVGAEGGYTMLSSLPLFREGAGVAQALAGDKARYEGPQGAAGLTQIVTAMGRTGMQVHDYMAGKEPRTVNGVNVALIKSLIDTAGMTIGAPSVEAKKLLDVWMEEQKTGQSDWQHRLFGLPPKK